MIFSILECAVAGNVRCGLIFLIIVFLGFIGFKILHGLYLKGKWYIKFLMVCLVGLFIYRWIKDPEVVEAWIFLSMDRLAILIETALDLPETF